MKMYTDMWKDYSLEELEKAVDWAFTSTKFCGACKGMCYKGVLMQLIEEYCKRKNAIAWEEEDVKDRENS